MVTPAKELLDYTGDPDYQYMAEERAVRLSTAISLKRIADSLEKMQKGQELIISVDEATTRVVHIEP